MWILILALYASPHAGNAFSTLHTQEFDTATACQQAAKQFTEKFETFKDMDAKAICVKKSYRKRRILRIQLYNNDITFIILQNPKDYFFIHGIRNFDHDDKGRLR